MSTASWIQFVALGLALAASVPVVGSYLAKVFGGGSAPGDRFFGPVERLVYRATGVDPEREQRWTTYAGAVLAFSVVSVLALYLLQRVQGSLPFNPTGATDVPPALAFNTAVSFVTNTNWQNYAGENTMSHLTQMTGLAVQNFVSAAVGLAVAIAFIRGLVRRRSGTLGNFWVDLTRGLVRVLLPLAFVAALVLVSQGVVQNAGGFRDVTTVEGSAQVIPGGPAASQEAIKEVGTNGGGFLNANSAHPFGNPNGLTNALEIYLLLVIPFSLAWTFGKLAGDRRQGLAVLGAMVVLWVASVGIATGFEVGGTLEGKEVRFGEVGSAVFAASTTGTSTGAVNAAHDSFTAGGGAVPMVNILLGEVSPGGVGAGLYGMLIFALLAVFIAGLMVGRTPEYLGKKIQAAEMKLVVLYILVVPVFVLGLTAISVVTADPQASILNPGPHGLSEVTYAFASAGNNNGSAFGGLTGNTDWYNATLGLAMLAGRFLLIVPALAIAGGLARKPRIPVSSGTFPTGTPLFAGLLVGVVLIVVGLTYFPVLSLGPIVEQLGT